MALEQIARELDRCNKCGFCQSACPTFRVTGFEWLVTRGRVSLAQDLAEGTAAFTDPEVMEAIDSCLVCGACIDACPPQIQIHDVVYAVRQERVARSGLSGLERVILRGLLPRPRLLGVVARLGYLAERLKLRRLAGKFLKGRLRRAAETGPNLPGSTARGLIGKPAPVPNPRARVAYFLSCTKEFIYSRAAQATVEVLRRNGVEVVIPETVCCGLACTSAGDAEGAKILAKKNISYLRGLEVDAIICDEGSCTAHLADYPEILKGTAEEDEARAMVSKLMELSAFLDQIGMTPMTHPVEATVTWHDPCSMRHYLKITQPPRRLIQAVPGVTFVEATNASMCCGGAGAVMITQPELSDEILQVKTAALRETGANYVVTSSPSCVMQLGRGETQVLYLSELLAMGYGVKV
ncbi:MAG: (Fe-S)-binding protein [Bacillota bacterium]